MQPEIFREVRVTDEIGDDPEGRRRDHHRHDGKPVQPVGQVHRVRRADDHDHREGDEEEPQIDKDILEDRQGKLIAEIGGMDIGRSRPSDGRDQ